MLFRVFFLSLLLLPSALADQDVSPQFRQFLKWDAENNKVKIVGQSEYGNQTTAFQQRVLDMPHVDISLEDAAKLYQIGSHDDWIRGPGGARGPNAAIVDVADYVPEDLKQYFFVEKNGKKYMRYYFHPLDDHYRPQLMEYLRANNIPHETGSVMKAYSTASRSVIAFDPKTGRGFSLKTNTNRTSQGAGPGELRPLPTRYAEVIRRLSDSLYPYRAQLRHLDIAWEPLSIGLPAVDQSISVRLMEDVNAGKVTHLSGFVFNDTEEAKRIAQRAGQTFDQFWDEAFRTKGKAMAEMALIAGFWSQSNHAQNFRWELDAAGKLTGRVVFIDISDGKPSEEIFKARGQEQFLEDWIFHTSNNGIPDSGNYPTRKGMYFSNFFRGDFGSVPPKYHELMRQGIAERTAELLGLDKNTILKAMRVENRNGWSYGWSISTEDENSEITKAFKRHLERIRSPGPLARPPSSSVSAPDADRVSCKRWYQFWRY